MSVQRTDVIVVGAGIAGAAAAFALARQGIAVTVVDPDREHPADFRCEKLLEGQIALFERLGLGDVIARPATKVSEVVIARGGRVVDVQPAHEYCMRYDAMVNAVRRAWPSPVNFIQGRVDQITPGGERPAVTLGSGEVLEGRLVILATGLGEKLRAGLGMERRLIRAKQSICLGCDLVTADGKAISKRALVYYGERAGDAIAFATFFPIGQVTRMNLFCYLDPAHSIIKEFRRKPMDSIGAALPGVGRVLGDVRIVGQPELRVSDLYEVDPKGCDGVVLIGDANRSSCPVTGTGFTRCLTDVERLCNVHAPGWLATPGMAAAKIAAYYDDTEKRATDGLAAALAERERNFAVLTTLPWRARRLVAVVRAHVNNAKSQVRRLKSGKGAPATTFDPEDRLASPFARRV